MKKNKKPDVLLVSFDDFSNDSPILIIGRKSEENPINIINALQGEEALELYKKLTTKKGG